MAASSERNHRISRSGVLQLSSEVTDSGSGEAIVHGLREIIEDILEKILER